MSKTFAGFEPPTCTTLNISTNRILFLTDFRCFQESVCINHQNLPRNKKKILLGTNEKLKKTSVNNNPTQNPHKFLSAI